MVGCKGELDGVMKRCEGGGDGIHDYLRSEGVARYSSIADAGEGGL